MGSLVHVCPGALGAGAALHEYHTDRRHGKTHVSGKGRLTSTAASLSMLPPELADFGIASP